MGADADSELRRLSAIAVPPAGGMSAYASASARSPSTISPIKEDDEPRPRARAQVQAPPVPVGIRVTGSTEPAKPPNADSPSSSSAASQSSSSSFFSPSSPIGSFSDGNYAGRYDECIEQMMLLADDRVFKLKVTDLSAVSAEQITTFTITSWFPKQFHAVRLHYCGGDYDFIQSLSRCNKFEATGGKSGSTFSKTKDGRFILKYVSKKELEMFERFGRNYFRYMAASAFHGVQTCLVKMLGVFMLSWKKKRIDNSDTDRMKHTCVIVMPNLFYDRVMTRVFDLKGSERNRKIAKEQSRDTKRVLLDSNLMECAFIARGGVREWAFCGADI